MIREEFWIPVYGFEDYEVSNLGNIRSKARTRTFTLSRKGHVHEETWRMREKILKRVYPGCNEPSVHLYQNRKRKAMYVKTIVFVSFEALDGTPKDRKSIDIRHKDGNKDNCAITNLYLRR